MRSGKGLRVDMGRFSEARRTFWRFGPQSIQPKPLGGDPVKTKSFYWTLRPSNLFTFKTSGSQAK